MDILLADHSFQAHENLSDVLTGAGFSTHKCLPEQLPKILQRTQHFDIVLLGIDFIAGDFSTNLDQIKEEHPDARVIVITDRQHVVQALEAVENGAYTYLEKPFIPQKLLLEVRNCATQIKLSRQANYLRKSAAESARKELLGDSEVMTALKKQISKAAASDARVLITGPNGVGKELVAEALHHGSARADNPLVKVNCAAIPRELIESELFGYERGAFTGAYDRKIGMIEEADGGTLFLDEVGDMALETQAKLLRVLQENEFVRVGGTQAIPFDVRVIAATNKNLRTAIKKGEFRSDLYFRLNVLPLHVPSLAEHREDIELLARHFLKKAGAPRGEEKRLSTDAARLLQEYAWPGNVRELRNYMERAAIMVERDEIKLEDLQRILPDLSASRGKIEAGAVGSGSLRELLESYEHSLLVSAYEQSKGNVSKMARILQTDRANLHRKLARYKIR